MLPCAEVSDYVGGVDDLSYRDVMVQRVDDQSQEFTHIGNDEIRAFGNFRRQIGQVGSDDAGNIAFFIVLIEFFQTVCEQAEGGADDDILCATFFQLFGNIAHSFSGRNHVIHDDNGFAGDIGSQEFVGDDRIFAVYDGRVITAFVEHTHVHAEDIGKIDCSVHGTFIRADDHQMFFVDLQIRFGF